ncbi:transcriptional regulator, DeoR family [Quadrisphaera sp. DSM 44207]|nr:transcriptional regulator, DeoR family [Quadrisphaera sp. DSM 44207]
MFAHERQERIARQVAEHGRAAVADLAVALAVSEDTIRRDLRALASRGVVHKTHGGALAPDTARLGWREREGVEADAKAAIGALAAGLVAPGQSVVLDAGSTVLALARHLRARPLTVLTSSLDVAAVFDADPDVELSLTGGDWDARSRYLTGSTALHALGSRRADWAFLGTCALHRTAGATSVTDRDAAVKRAMLAAADRGVVLADRTKHARILPHLIAPLDTLYAVVTDEPATASDLDDLAGLRVLRADTAA